MTLVRDPPLGMLSTDVGDTCLMPFHLYEGQSGRLIASALHPGQTPAAKAVLGQSRHQPSAPRGAQTAPG